MRPRHVPVSSGSVESVTLETSAVIVSDVRFPARAVLPAHTHGRTIVGVMLSGSFESAIA